MQSVFIKIVDITILLAAAYHGGYGLFSVGKDYIASRPLQILMTLLVAGVMFWFAWIGLKLIFTI
jgi:succinate dehydrogenase hydrophobic anchor subunit